MSDPFAFLLTDPLTRSLKPTFSMLRWVVFFLKVSLSSLLVLTTLSSFPSFYIISVSNLPVFSIERHLISKSQTAFSWKVKRTSGGGYIQLSAAWTDIGGNQLIRFLSLFQSSTLDHAWRTHPFCIQMFSHNLYIVLTISSNSDSKGEPLYFDSDQLMCWQCNADRWSKLTEIIIGNFPLSLLPSITALNPSLQISHSFNRNSLLYKKIVICVWRELKIIKKNHI